MNNIKSNLMITFLLTLIFSFTMLAQESYKLEYKFQKGKTYRYSILSNSNITQEMMGKEMKMTNSANMVMRAIADNIDNEGNISLVVSFESATNNTKSPMMDTTMVLKSIIDKRTKLTLSKLGTVISREIIDTIKNEGMMGGGTQRNMSSITKLPEKPIKTGEKWTSSSLDTIESMGGKIMHSTNMEFTLTGKEKKQNHDCLKIDYTGTTSDTGKMMMNGMELFVEGSGKVKGTMYFDPKLGITIFDESTADNDQTMAVTGQQNMTIPVSVSSKSVRSYLEK